LRGKAGQLTVIIPVSKTGQCLDFEVFFLDVAPRVSVLDAGVASGWVEDGSCDPVEGTVAVLHCSALFCTVLHCSALSGDCLWRLSGAMPPRRIYVSKMEVWSVTPLVAKIVQPFDGLTVFRAPGTVVFLCDLVISKQ
jgi:hypothetical protein